jgi:hypothetical protein
VAVRALVVLFAGTVSVTVPSPLPLAGDTATHPSLDDTDHVQPACAATVTAAVSPPTASDKLVGDTT